MIEVLKSFYIPEKREYKIKVRWWKCSNDIKKCYCMNLVQRIRVKQDDLVNWKVLNF